MTNFEVKIHEDSIKLCISYNVFFFVQLFFFSGKEAIIIDTGTPERALLVDLFLPGDRDDPTHDEGALYVVESRDGFCRTRYVPPHLVRFKPEYDSAASNDEDMEEL